MTARNQISTGEDYMFAQREKLKHYLSKGNFELKAKVARKLVELLGAKPALTDFKVRVDYHATPQGKSLDRPGDIFLTIPSASFEDANLATRIHCAVMIECLPDAQPVTVLTENDSFLQLPFIYSVPLAGKWSKREARGPRESYALPWCPLDEDGAERAGGREYSIPLERAVSAMRNELPSFENISTSLALKDASNEIAHDRLMGACEVLVENSLDIIGGLKDLQGRMAMQIDLLLVWPVLVSENPPLIVRDSESEPVPVDRVVWWTPVDANAFVATSGITPPAQSFMSGAGMFVTVIGYDSMTEYVDTLDKMFEDIKNRFERFRLQDLYG